MDDEKFGFIDKTGNFKIKPIYADLEPFDGNYAIASLDGESYGLIDKNGNQIVEFKYSSIEYDTEGFFKLTPIDLENTDFYGEEGYEEEEEDYDDIEEEYIEGDENDDFEEEDEEEEEDDDEEEEEDDDEEEEIDDTIVEFEDYTVTKYGFIDKQGKQVIPCIYDSVYSFDDGITRVEQNGEWFFIDKKGNPMFKNKDIETSSEPGLLKEKKNDLYGLIDLNGNQILDFKYDEIDDFSEGFAKVEKNNKIGYINKKGIEIIACKYDYGYDFVNGFVNVTLDDKQIIINEIGEVISNSEYDEVNDFNEGLCKVGLEDKYGFIDQKGKVIVPLIYDEASIFSNGYSCVDYEGKKLLIDKLGKNSLKTDYDEILPFSDGLARVSLKDKYGFIDVNGIEVIKCIYDDAESFSNGVAEVELKSQKQLIDKTGKVLFNKDFDFIGSFQEDFAIIQVDSLWGFIDSKANKLTEFIYEDAESFSNGLAAVKMDEKWGYINSLGKEVIPFEYESASSFTEDLARISQTQIIKREKFNGIVLTNDYPVNSYGDVQKLKDIIVKDFKQIRFISKNLQEDESAIKELINLNNKIFPYLPVELKNNESIIKIAIEAGYYDESFIEYIDINNTELLKKIISKAPLYFKLIPESSKSVDLTRIAVMKGDEIELISDSHSITTKVFNGDSPSGVSDIGTLYHVNGYCEFTLGYDNNCYLSEDVAGVIDYEVINEFLESDESWSDYIWGESWHDYNSIYHSYGIIEPASDLKLPNEEIVSVNLKYEMPEYDKFTDCFKRSEPGDFVHIASSDEKSYSWEGWKRYKLEFAPGIFDVNKISVEFEGDIVSGYAYNYSEDRSDDFEEISDYSTSGKGFTGDLYFNNGKALISVDSDELKEALGDAGIEYDEHEKLKEFCEKFYQDKTE